MAGLEFILCRSCGRDLSSLVPAFKFLTLIKKKRVIHTKTEISIANLDLTAGLLTYEDILNYLNIDPLKYCCRSHMTNHANIRDFYYK